MAKCKYIIIFLISKKSSAESTTINKKSAGTCADAHIKTIDRITTRSLKGVINNQNISILFTTLNNAQTSFLWMGNEG